MAELHSAILGVGAGIPEKVLTNDDLEKMVDTSDSWIRKRTGIVRRHIAGPGETTSSLATEASRVALRMAGVSPKAVDLIICATVTPDYYLPATAALIQQQLGATNASGFDLSAACAGFLYGLSIADQYIRTGMARNILVIGVETLSRIVNWQDRTTCVVLADGAGAILVGAGEEEGIIASNLYLDGSLNDLILQPAGGSREPITKEIIEEGRHYLTMRGNEVFRVAVRYMGRAMRDVLEATGTDPDAIDWMVPHQVNQRITQSLTEYLGLDPAKVYSNIHEYGNTSAASIPIALWEMTTKNLLRKGQLVAMAALGGGIAYGAALARWSI